MKRVITCMLGITFLWGVTTIQATTIKPIKTAEEKLGYSMGNMTGKAFKEHGVKIQLDHFCAGLKDGYLDKEPRLTEDQMREVIEKFQKESLEKQKEEEKKKAELNAKEGEAFLSNYKNQPGVKVLPSGLQYKVREIGKSDISPSLDDTVVVNYEGHLLDGTEFDSSYKRGEPAKIPVKGVIKGWQEALLHMHIGDEWEIVIPPNLAYGDVGIPGTKITPNQTLIFRVSLLSIDGPNTPEKK